LHKNDISDKLKPVPPLLSSLTSVPEPSE